MNLTSIFRNGFWFAAVAICSLLLQSSPVGAAIYTYSITNGTSDLWSSGTHWDDGVSSTSNVPVSSANTDIIFAPLGGSYFAGSLTNTSTNNLGSLVLSQLWLNGTGDLNSFSSNPVSVTITGGALSFTNYSQINLNANHGPGSSTVSYAVNSAITTSNFLTLSGNGSANFSLGGVISGSGGLVKAGSSRVTLSGANTYSGLTFISGGTLVATQLAGGGVASNIGSSSSAASNLIINGGTLLYMGGAQNTDRLFQIGSTSEGGTGTIASSGTGALNFTNTGGITYGTIDQSRTLVLGGGNTGANTLAATIANNGSGAVSLAKNDSGTWVLTANHTYTGSTTVNGGTLQLGNTGNILSDSSALIVNGGIFALGTANETVGSLSGGNGSIQLFNGSGRTLTVNQSTDGTFAGVLQGTGGNLVKAGTGMLTLAGSNTYSGDTTVSAGTLQIGAGSTTGSIAGNIVDNGAVIFNRSNDLTYDGVISGSGTVTKTGTGTLTLGGANTYSGATTVDGGTLKYSSATSTQLPATTRVYIHNGATLDLGGGARTIAGLGTASDAAVGNVTNGTLLTGAGGIFLRSGTINATFTGSSASGRLWIGGDSSGVVNLSGTNDMIYTADHSSVIIGHSTTGAAGTVKVGNANALAAATEEVHVYSGTLDLNGQTAVRAGKIMLQGYGDSSLINSSTSAAASTNSNIGLTTVNNVGGAGNLTLGGVISGSGGSLVKIGAGTLTLNGSNTYTGGTMLGTGVIHFTTGSNFGTGNITLNGGTLQWATGSTFDISSRLNALGTSGGIFDTNSNDVTLASIISGSGPLTKKGAGTLILSAANTYGGATTIAGGTLRLTAGNQLPAATTVYISNGATLDLGGGTRSLSSLGTSANAVDGNITNGTLTMGAGGIYLRNGTTSATFAGSSPSGRLWIGGDSLGAVNLNGTNDSIFTADHHAVIIGHTTTGAAGTVKVGNANALAAATEEVQVFAGTLDLNGQTGVRAGNLVLAGNGGSFLINGNTSTAASTNVNISLSTGNNLGGAGNLTLGGVMSGGSLVKNGVGTLTLNGSNTYSGGTTIHQGTLTMGSATALGTGQTLAGSGGTLNLNGYNQSFNSLSGSTNISLGGATLTVAGAGNNTFGGMINGNGALAKTGTGNLTLTGNNTYIGSTTVSGGLINFASGANFGAGNITLNGGGLQWASGSTTDISSRLNAFGANGATLDTNGNHVTLAGVLSGASLAKTGVGTLTLSGTNTYSGGTTVNSDLVHFANGTNLGTGNITLNGGGLQWATGNTVDISSRLNALGTNGATFDTNGNNVALASTLSGASLTKAGTGTLTLSGTNLYTGGTTVNSGLIRFSSAANFGSGNITLSGGGLQWATGNTVDISSRLNALGSSGTVFDTNGNNVTLATGLSGTGGLTKIGTDLLILTGANSYSGGTVISGGKLQIGNGGTTGSISGNIANSGTLEFNRSDNSSYSGTVNGGLVVKSGAGTMIFSGNGSSGTLAVNGGMLQIGNGATGSFATSNPITVGAGATLGFNQADESFISASGGNLLSIINQGTVAGMAEAGKVNFLYANISGNGRFLQSGEGVTNLLSITGNTYTGGTVISAGTLWVGGGPAARTSLGSGAIVNNGTLVYDIGHLSDYNVGNNISGTGSLWVVGSDASRVGQYSIVNLQGNNTYTGATLVDGSLDYRSDTALGNNSAVTVNGYLGSAFQNSFSIGSLAGTGSVQVYGGKNYSIGGDNTSTTFSGIISQAVFQAGAPVNLTGSLTKTGTGTFLLSGNNYLLFNTIVAGGTLQIGNGISGSIDDTNSVTVGSTGTIAFNQANGKTFARPILNDGMVVGLESTGNINTLSGVISGSGGFTQNGAGTTVLSGANSFTGGITINAGTLSANSTTALGSGSNDLTLANVAGANVGAIPGASLNLNGNSQTIKSLSGGGAAGGNIALGAATLTVNGSANTTYGGILSGTGKLTKSGTGTLTLANTNTYTGGTTINSGGLQLGNGGTTGTVVGNIVNNGTLAFNRSDAATYSNAISGTGSVSQLGKGTITLSGASSYAGATLIDGGKLVAGSATGLGNTSSITLANTVGTGLDLNSYSRSIGSLSGGGTIGGNVALGSATLTVGSANTNTTYGAVISGSGGLTKTGTGSLHLTGTNTYTGATTINGGTLVLHGTNTALPVGASLVLEAGQGVTTSGGQVTGWADQSSFGNHATAGGGSVTVGTLSNGAPTLVFNGSSFLNDPLSGSKSTFSIFTVAQYTGTPGGIQTILGSTAYGNLQYALNGNKQSLIKQGDLFGTFGQNGVSPDTPTILGVSVYVNNVMSFYKGLTVDPYGGGGAPANAGLASTSVIGAAKTASGAMGQYLTGNISALIVYDTNLGSSTALAIQNYLDWKYFGGPVPYTNTLSSGTTLSLTATGAALDLNGGRETVASLSGVAGTSIYLGDGILTVGANNASTTFAGAMSDSGGLSTGTGGSLVKNGTGTLIFSGNNTNTGGITINAGALQVGTGSTTGNLGSGGVINNAALSYNRSDSLIESNAISGTGSVTKNGTGTTTLTGTNTYSGVTTVNAGTLQVGNGTSGGIDGTSSVVTAAAGTIVFNRANGSTFSKSIANSGAVVGAEGSGVTNTLSGVISGTGSFTQSGEGTTILSGANTYTGATAVTAGTLQVGNGSSGTINSSSSYTVGGSGTLGFNLANNSAFSKAITNNGTVAGKEGSGITNTLSGVISGSGGFTQAGEGTTVLTGANTYTGGTSITAGILQIGSGGTTGSITGNITDNAALVFNRSDAVSYSGIVSGSGSLSKSGAGQLTLTGAHTYSGGTTINGGSLQLGNGGTSGSLSGNVALGNGGQLAFNRNDAPTAAYAFAGVVSGNGSLRQAGSGTVNLSGTNTFSGGTTLDNGTIEIANNSALGSGLVTINGGIIRAAGAERNLSNNLKLNGSFGLGRATSFGGDVTLANDITITATNPDTNGTFYISTLSGVIHDDSVNTHRSLTFTTGANPGSQIALTGNNTYSGGTTLQSGTLSVGNNQGLGTGKVTVTGGTLLVQKGFAIVNEIQLNGGTLSKQLAGNGSLVNAATASSGPNGTGTKAEIMAGTLGGSSVDVVTLSSSFSDTATLEASNDDQRLGDVYHLSGTGSNVFVLQLTVAGVGADSYLGWLNGGAWVNAVDGNTGNNALAEMQGFDGTYAQFVALYSSFTLSQYIGAYGRDANGDTVWAVINHNSDFSAVPEPGTWVLMVVGLLVVGWAVRQKKSSKC